MTGALFIAAARAMAVHRHRGHIVGSVILLVVLVVLIVLLVQRIQNRRPIAEGSPTALAHATSPTHRDAAAHATVTVGNVALDAPPPPGHYNLIDLARSEWTKLRSVRSTMWTVVVTIALGLGVSAIATAETRANWSTMTPMAIRTFDPISLSLIGTFIAQFAIGVLGVLVVSAEYTTGTVRAVFCAAPHRRSVLLAKILVFSVVAVVVAEFVSFASFLLGQSLLSSPAVHATLATPGALRAVVGCGLYIAALGLLGLGLATIIRHSAAAISTFVGILLILPILVSALPTSIAQDVRRFLPDRIGADMLSANGSLAGSHLFSPWVGFLVLVGYVVVANVIGAILLTRRDA